MTIKVGLHTFMRGVMSSREGTIAVAKKAEELGFSHLGVNDHVVVPSDITSKYPYTQHGEWPGRTVGECLELLTTMAFIAGCTSKIRILSSVMILPYRPAVLTAKMLSTADVLSGGRIILGCGVGWMPEEFVALNAPDFAARGAVTDEWLEAFKTLWTQDDPRMEAKHVKFSNISFMPKPIAPGGLPIWIGGESAVAMKRTVRIGHGWYPASNNPQMKLDTPARMKGAIDELVKVSHAAGRDPSSIDIGLLYLTGVNWNEGNGGDRPFLSGQSAQMVEDLVAMKKAGVGNISLIFQTAQLNETLERMERFGKEVLPHIS